MPKTIEEIRAEISKFIIKFKDSDDLNTSYSEFDFEWLEPFEKELAENVKIEFDCVRNERIYGDGEYTNMVLNDFIVSLEKLIEN